MEIRRIYTSYMHNSEKPAGKPGKTADDSSPAGKVSGNVDTIELSSNASFRSQLESAKKSCVKAVSGEISPQRIAELKNRYQGNSCPVPGESVAGAILNRILGSDDQ